MRIKKIQDVAGAVGSMATEYTESSNAYYNAPYINNINKYSTEETFTGQYWIDSKPIYRKVLEYSVNSTGVSSFTHNLNIDRLVKLDGLCTVAGQSVSSNGYRNIPYQVSNSEYFMVESVRTNSILFYVGTWTNNKAYVILEYTKTTD